MKFGLLSIGNVVKITVSREITSRRDTANHSPAIDVLSQRRCEIFSFRKHLKQLSTVTSEMIVNLLLNTLK